MAILLLAYLLCIFVFVYYSIKFAYAGDIEDINKYGSRMIGSLIVWLTFQISLLILIGV